MKKRVLSLLLTVCMVFFALPQTAFAELTITYPVLTITDIQDDIDSATGNIILKLMSNITGDALIPPRNGYDVTIDLNGKTWVQEGFNVIGHEGTGTLTIKDSGTGGTLKSANGTGSAIYNYSGTVEVTGGTIESTNNYAIYNNGVGTVTITGGTIKGRIAAINVRPTITVGADYEVIASRNFDGTNPETYNPANIDAYEYLEVRRVQEVNDIQSAIDNATGNISLKLMSNITGEATIPYGNAYDITIDLNGNTWTNSYSVINHRGTGTVTIKDSGTGGTVESTNDVAILNISTGTVTVSGGAVESTNGDAIHNNSTGTVTISGGAVESTNGDAIHNNSTGTVTISGGTIKGGTRAMNVTPTIAVGADYEIVASRNFDGTNTETYNPANIDAYKYLEVRPKATVITIPPVPVGVTAPKTGEAPATTIAETAEYTGMVSWNPAPTTDFAENTIYTATITLTPKSGYTFNGVAENSFTVEGAIATNAANSGVITAVFPKTTSVNKKAIIPDGGSVGYLTDYDSDKAVLVLPDPEKIVLSEETAVPKTGDETENIGWLLMVLFVTAAGAFVMSHILRRKAN